MVDVETDGPIPGDYSMLSLGAVRISNNSLVDSVYLQFQPISDRFNKSALDVCGFTREQTMSFPSAAESTVQFHDWLAGNASPMRFVSDNNGFDWMFTCWYLIHFTGSNPLGYTSMNLGSFYKGLIGDLSKNFKHLRETEHSHNALDDATGNAEAFLRMLHDHDVSFS
jgi:DNA polymerase III alpha subunit (gram-positive type)